MSLEGDDDDKNADTFGDAADEVGGLDDLSALSAETTKHEAFLIENNLRSGGGRPVAAGAAGDEGADWAGGDDLTNLHKQFMAEYTSRALSADEMPQHQPYAAAAGAGAGGAGAGGAAGGEDDADFSLKSVLRAIDDEDSSAPISHAARVARQPVPSADPLLTPQKPLGGAGAGGAGFGVPATPPNPWAFTKPPPGSSPFMSSFGMWGDSTFKAATPSKPQPPQPQQLAQQPQQPQQRPAQPKPQQQLPQSPQQPAQHPPQPQPQPGSAMKKGVMSIEDLEASLRNPSAGQPQGQSNGLPPVLANFLAAGKGAPQQPPPGMSSGQSFLQALQSGSLPPHMTPQGQPQPQRPNNIQLPPQQQQPQGAYPFPQHAMGRPPMPMPMSMPPGMGMMGPGPMPPGGMPGMPQHYSQGHPQGHPQGHSQGHQSHASGLSDGSASPMSPAPPGTLATEGNWYIPLPQRFSHTQMTKQEIAYVIRMQLKQLLPRPTLFLPSSNSGSSNADGEDSTTGTSGAGAGSGGANPSASPSLSPSKPHGGDRESSERPGAVMAPPVLPDDLAQDDFYCQVFTARKGQRTAMIASAGAAGATGSGNALPPSPFRNPDGSPKLPEGTLGRIAASSLRKPKKLMSLTGGATPLASSLSSGLNPMPEGEKDSKSAKEPEKVDDSSSDVPARQFMFGRFSLTYLIEEGVRCLMNVEDVDSVLAAFGGPAQQRFEDPRRTYERRRLLAQREQLTARLAEALDISDPSVPMDADHLLLKFAAAPKGRLLLFRSMLMLPPPQVSQIISILMNNLSAVACPDQKSAVDSKLATLISDGLFNMPLAQLNPAFHVFLSQRNTANITQLLRTKLGCLVAQVFMKRGHNLALSLQQAQQALAAHTAAARNAGHSGEPQINPQLAAQFAALNQALAQWRQLLDYFVATVLPGKLAGLFAAPLKRGAEAPAADAKAASASAGGLQMPQAVPVQSASSSKDDKEAAAATAAAATEYTSIGALWELIAAVLSHVRKEQRPAFITEFRGLLKTEIDYISQKIEESRPAGAPPAALQLQLPPALSYLAANAFPPAAPAAAAGGAPAAASASAGSSAPPATAAAPAQAAAAGAAKDK